MTIKMISDKTIFISILCSGLLAVCLNYGYQKSMSETEMLLSEISKTVDEVESSTIVSKIGDVCDDQNKLTQDDLYLDTKGTCKGGLYKESKLAKVEKPAVVMASSSQKVVSK
jgi:hypothetical protein